MTHQHNKNWRCRGVSNLSFTHCNRAALFILTLFFLCLLFATTAIAETGEADGLVDRMAELFNKSGERVGKLVNTLLFTLLIVDVILTFGRAMITDADLATTFYQFLRRLLFVVLIFFFIDNSTDIIKNIIEIALKVAQAAAGNISADSNGSNIVTRPSIGKILSDGTAMALKTLESAGFSLVHTFVFAIICCLQLLITVFVAFLILLAFAELYFLALTGMFVLGFGGWSQTAGTATEYFKVLIAGALKLMTIMVIYGFTVGFTKDLTASGELGPTCMAIMLQFIGVLFMGTLPSQIGKLMSTVGGGGVTEKAAGMPVNIATGGAKAGVRALASNLRRNSG